MDRRKFLKVSGSLAVGGIMLSPYRRVYGFMSPDEICALEVDGGSIYIAMPNNISVYGMSGELQTNFPIPSDLRDMTVHDGLIYALFPTRIEVYNRQGDMTMEWEACSDNSDYCGKCSLYSTGGSGTGSRNNTWQHSWQWMASYQDAEPEYCCSGQRTYTSPWNSGFRS